MSAEIAWEDLPEELHAHILQFLTPIDVLRLSTVSSRMHATATDDAVWSVFCARESIEQTPSEDFATYKDIFREFQSSVVVYGAWLLVRKHGCMYLVNRSDNIGVQFKLLDRASIAAEAAKGHSSPIRVQTHLIQGQLSLVDSKLSCCLYPDTYIARIPRETWSQAKELILPCSFGGYDFTETNPKGETRLEMRSAVRPSFGFGLRRNCNGWVSVLDPSFVGGETNMWSSDDCSNFKRTDKGDTAACAAMSARMQKIKTGVAEFTDDGGDGDKHIRFFQV
jgi:hypothetical protein